MLQSFPNLPESPESLHHPPVNAAGLPVSIFECLRNSLAVDRHAAALLQRPAHISKHLPQGRQVVQVVRTQGRRLVQHHVVEGQVVAHRHVQVVGQVVVDVLEQSFGAFRVLVFFVGISEQTGLFGWDDGQ